MIYNDFQELKLSRLGFGTMRLPLNEDQTIDEATTEKMVELAISNGVNYFDTAYPYHEGLSEVVIGKCLKKYPRDSFYLATKFPGHQIMSEYHPDEIFEEQLEKCQVDYFDFYLLHNVNDSSVKIYEDEKWGIIDYFVKQKQLGKIKHLGMSSHGTAQMLDDFLTNHPGLIEFVQIQLNYLDYSLQDAKSKVEVLEKHNIPIWVMEPLRGGKLANVEDENLTIPAVEAAFRWLLEFDSVKMILSGMSNEEQMRQNIEIFCRYQPLIESEKEMLYQIAEGMKNALPCTGCRYCCEGCPMELNIPHLIQLYNDYNFSQSMSTVMIVDALDEDKKPSACIGCGQCSQMCPQGIDIPGAMSDFADKLAKGPKWADICKAREEAAKRNKR